MSGDARDSEQLREAIRDLIARDVAGDTLLAHARIQAHARALEILTTMMTDELLAAASARARHPHADTEQADSLGWYVYGVVDGDTEVPPWAGIDPRHRLQAIGNDGLVAIASRVSLSEFGDETLQDRLQDLGWLEEKARGHEQLLDLIRERATLVPMRLCTTYSSEAAVLSMLAREASFLLDALDRLEGRTEWGVKLFRRGDSANAGGDGPEAASLEAELSSDAHARLAAVTAEARVNPLQPPELTNREGTMILNGVYLVEDAEEHSFSVVVDRLRAELDARGLDVEVTGPWPPYNFVNSSIEVGL